MGENVLIISSIEATVHLEFSEVEKGRLLYSEIEKDKEKWEAILSITGTRHIGPTKGYYTFFVRMPISRVYDFKDFLLDFCKQQKLSSSL